MSILEKLLSPKQVQALIASKSRTNIWEGSVRSGKTHASFWWWLRFARDQSPAQGDLLMVGKTERTLERNIINPMISMFGSGRISYSRGSGEGHIYGRRFYVAGANDERAQDKIRGMTLAGAYGDEVTLWPESFYEMLRSRLSPRGARFLGTTNPDSPAHWLKKRTLNRAGELDLCRVSFRLEDNIFLDPDFVTNLKKEYTGLWYKRFIEGEWCQAEGAVYDMWDEGKHVISNLPGSLQVLRWVVGCDYGTTNPTVFLLVGLGVDGTLYVVDEYCHDSREQGRQKTDVEYADDLERFLREHKKTSVEIVVDPSAASFLAELRRRRLRVSGADNAVLDGIRLVSTALSAGKLKVLLRCERLREEFLGYRWDEKAQSRGEDKPLKENDHALDALRYAVARLLSRGPAKLTSGGSRIAPNLFD